jgi:hypothetical protein
MNIKAYLEDAYRIIRDEPIILILGGLIVQLITVLSLGILAGPFMGGYTLLAILYLRDNKKPVFSDIFSGLQQFGALFPYFLVLLFIIIGLQLFILPGLLFATWWIYVLPLMVDRKMSFTDALRLSMSRVNEKGFLMHLVFLLLVSVIPVMLIQIASTVIPLIIVLNILLPPFQAGCLASLYIDQFQESAAELDAELQEVKASQPAITDTPPENADISSPNSEKTPTRNDQSTDTETAVNEKSDTDEMDIEGTETDKPDNK